MTTEAFISLVAAIGTPLSVALGLWLSRRKNRSEARKSDREGDATLSEAVLKWAEALRGEIDDLKTARLADAANIRRLEARIVGLEAALRRAEALARARAEQLMRAGIEPVDWSHADE